MQSEFEFDVRFKNCNFSDLKKEIACAHVGVKSIRTCQLVITT